MLHPISTLAAQDVRRIAEESGSHIIDTNAADQLDVDYTLEDDAKRFGLAGGAAGRSAGEYAIVLRLSAGVKNPLQGFTFGRNAARCDVWFSLDQMRQLSNVHFRIYVNDFGVVMIEDQSTNGTQVDDQLLKLKTKQGHHTKRTLSSGTRISVPMHEHGEYRFIVRIPKREGEYERAYRRNLADYLNRLRRLQGHEDGDGDRTILPGPGGHVSDWLQQGAISLAAPGTLLTMKQVDLFPPGHDAPRADALPRLTVPNDDDDLTGSEWKGSNGYNRGDRIGKGAFATVYEVTSQFDGAQYAAKELEKRRFMKNGVLDQKVETEMRIMRSIEHVSPHARSHGGAQAFR